MTSFFHTGRIYGPYVRVTGTHHPYIRAVHTARIYGRKKYKKVHPYIRAVYMARIYGPYIRVVCIGLKAQRVAKVAIVPKTE